MLRWRPFRPATCLAFVPFRDRDKRARLCPPSSDAARETWRRKDARGIDVSAIEHMDRRCLSLLRETASIVPWVSVGPRHGYRSTITLEHPRDATDEAFAEIGRSRDPNGIDTPSCGLPGA